LNTTQRGVLIVVELGSTSQPTFVENNTLEQQSEDIPENIEKMIQKTIFDI